MVRAQGSRSLNADEQIHYRRCMSSSPLAETAIARDLENYADNEDSITTTEDEEHSEASTVRAINSQPGTAPHSLVGSYQRPSFFTTVSHSTVVPHRGEPECLSWRERGQAIEEERRLLTDNHIISDDIRTNDQSGRRRRFSGLLSRSLRSKSPEPVDPLESGSGVERRERTEAVAVPTETTSLLGAGNGGPDYSLGDAEAIDRKWEEAVVAGLIHTTWKREALVISRYAAPLTVTFLLQYSLTVASIFTLGHLGKKELGAVSLASMTANITGYAVYQGLATSLDTLCSQAYGSGKKKLVGLQMQKMVFFLWTITIPIALIWFFADMILMRIVPEKEVAELAGLYLKVVALGAPGYACFESGKRYMQAQGLFSASLFVLLICAPFNAFMNWFLVWKVGLGFVGAPISVAITDWLMPFFLFLYVYFVAGSECWNGLTKRAFRNWGPMIQLALPGLVMVEAECLAFEVLTLASSWLGTTPLAAQSILSTIASIAFQIPFPVSISGSTRVANLIGATLVDAAKTSAKVTMGGAVIVGLLNMIVLSSLRRYIPLLFTSDEEVIKLVAGVLPLCAAFQLFDALAANCNGIMRGIGRQEIGGYVQLFSYYAIAMPISFGTTFGLNWGLFGLWSGVAIALCLVSIIEMIFLTRADWNRAVTDALRRNAMT
ncbi:MATE family efflux transporter [Aspergillus novofumigatus IBT 16806]|uniref:Putative MATE efflux family protein subfamily n=1 Tax=Aspergillus novofumigatus (strain IBT 16806) TaxID=1392255 RepID=A0A2I1CC71_ASPN1|nr:putative MATE efflux family protein subfamily [Aspergillus novofumigatus IBT 16806]PKX95235.1 putative MATE efflux family protein subfamily [Aspergillus novofumigatus IBT 16806]